MATMYVLKQKFYFFKSPRRSLFGKKYHVINPKKAVKGTFFKEKCGSYVKMISQVRLRSSDFRLAQSGNSCQPYCSLSMNKVFQK